MLINEMIRPIHPGRPRSLLGNGRWEPFLATSFPSTGSRIHSSAYAPCTWSSR